MGSATTFTNRWHDIAESIPLMVSPQQRWQFSLKSGIMTVLAVACVVCSSAYFEVAFSLVTIFGPIEAWTLASITRNINPAFPRRIYITTILCAAVVLLVFPMVDDSGIAAHIIPGLLGLWLPQLLFVAFFEWCEDEDAFVLSQESESWSRDDLFGDRK